MTTYTPSGVKKPEKKKAVTVKRNTTPDYEKYTYNAAEDDAYTSAVENLSAAQKNAPQYKGTYDGALRNLYGKIANREQFRFDVNEDKLYEQYRDRYALNGQLAMRDTMGQAASLTGGYGNTYAAAVGGQAYDAHLQQLNDVVPTLYGMALDRYNAEGDRLSQQYGMLRDMADTEYTQYESEMNRYLQTLDDLERQADTAYSRGYENFLNAYQMAADADRFAYDKEQDAYARQFAAEQFAYTQAQDALDRKTAAERFAYEKEQDAYARQDAADKFAYTQAQDALDRKAAAERFAYEKEQDARKLQTDAETFSFTQAQDAYERQLAAYDRLADLITATGYSPTESDLLAAGMTAAQANAYRGVYTQKNEKKSAGGGTPVKKQTTEEKKDEAKPENTVLSESEWNRQKAEIIRNNPNAFNNKRTKEYKTFAGSYRDYLLRQ